MFDLKKRANLLLWQALFLIFGTTWLWAPALNNTLSYRSSLISQYETTFQPYSWIFRLGDILAALLLLYMANYYLRVRRTAGILLMVVAVGSLLDPLLTTSCHLQGAVCKEYVSASFILHAAESTVTALAILALSIYDARARHRLASVLFVLFQPIYLAYSLTHISTQYGFNTLSQMAYQWLIVVWLAWYCRDNLGENKLVRSREARTVRYAAASWGVLNGLLAIGLSFYHSGIIGRFQSIYFAGGSDVVAQHGVVVGVIMLYLSRHLWRGEERARQIFLILLGGEVLKYAVITPHAGLLTFYFISFCGLFLLNDDFDRGSLPLEIKGRLKDAGWLAAMFLSTVLISFGVLYITHRHLLLNSLDNFSDYAFESHLPHFHHRSALLAHLLSAFIISSLAAILWALFKPTHPRVAANPDRTKIKELINRYAVSAEDYFKLWPEDKAYFWSNNQTGFIAYKIVGSIVFALPDPIAPKGARQQLLNNFVAWCKDRRLTVCFLPIYNQNSNKLYETAGLQVMTIGSTALIDAEAFQTTIRDKWWRWQMNRAQKAGYSYRQSKPPHSPEFIKQITKVSTAWLNTGHQERGFAMGYFEVDYLQNCLIHYLIDEQDRVVAFTNQLPSLGEVKTASIDLLRYDPAAKNSMPFLLAKTIDNIREQGYHYFDLGFVPFAASDEVILKVAKVIVSSQFSAAGLEQFKNKFDPTWQTTYMAYDGDLADLARIALKLDSSMKV